ncbi:hypothetical protein ENSA5_50930 [Enhygromyxa salina]|uniref:Endo-1,4-beta-xylanase A n=1 Tax=Enhygromyxa salina TaxID=215803 RepID=A0A2S9XGZ3_9BACT|nr:hypothetical protein ENSA5_50930 [Enhygromyxa salina]
MLAAALTASGCGDDVTTTTRGDADSETAGDGDGDSGDGDGDGDGDSGDGDSGDGDGDGDGDSGDGDGDTGDGDGDSGDGDGDAGDESCELAPQAMTLSLTGSQALPNSCNSHTFTGRLQNGGGAVWALDACPCDAQCLIPDPYTLTINLPDMDLLPATIMCPKIEMIKNEDCEVESIVIRDLDNNELATWVGSHAPSAPLTMPELSVAPVNGTMCLDHDQYALAFTLDNSDLTLSQGDAGVLGNGDAAWDAKSYASRETDEGPDYSWVLNR